MVYTIGQVGYTAFFVKNPEELISLFLPKHEHVFGHHATLQFNPENFNGVIPGKEILIKITVRVFDEKGDALLIETSRSEKEFPHITLSVADGVRRSYSDEMIKKAVQNNAVQSFDPIEILVIEGYFDGEKDIIK